MFPTCASNFMTVGLTSKMAGPSYLQYTALQQVVTSGQELRINPSDMTLKRTISTPITHPGALVDSSCFNPIQPLRTWDAELQNLYNAEFQEESSTAYQSQPFTDTEHRAKTTVTTVNLSPPPENLVAERLQGKNCLRKRVKSPVTATTNSVFTHLLAVNLIS